MSKITEQLKLESDETILRTVRKHWFILFAQTFGIIVMGIVPLVLLGMVIGGSLTPDFVDNPHLLVKPAIFFGAAWLLIIWMMLFGMWTDYYLDMWIITTKRILAVDQKGFFSRSVASFRFERLQNVTVDIHGIIPTLLDFGTIHADTASHNESFIMKGAPSPRDIKALIQEYADHVVMPPPGTPPSAQTASGI